MLTLFGRTPDRRVSDPLKCKLAHWFTTVGKVHTNFCFTAPFRVRSMFQTNKTDRHWARHVMWFTTI